MNASGVATVLKGKGPFTLVVPSRAAFEKFGDKQLDRLLRSDKSKELVALTKFHVVNGEYAIGSPTPAKWLLTSQGQRRGVQANGVVKIGNAKVTSADIRCSNGVIHIVDAVEMPAAFNLVEVLGADGRCKKFLAALNKSGGAELLQDGWICTLIVPTDAAIEALPPGEWEKLTLPAKSGGLPDLLKRHMLSGRVYSDDAIAAGSVTNALGTSVPVEARNGKMALGDALALASDLDASNGVIHIVDHVFPAGARTPEK